MIYWAVECYPHFVEKRLAPQSFKTEVNDVNLVTLLLRIFWVQI